MDSGLYLKVFASWEVIVVSLALMLLLPLVFYVASTRARPRRPLPGKKAPPKPAKKAAAKEPPTDAAEADE